MTTDYTYGDGKTEDAANFGIFKQNWGMLIECSSQFQGQTTADWNNGAALKYVNPERRVIGTVTTYKAYPVTISMPTLRLVRNARPFTAKTSGSPVIVMESPVWRIPIRKISSVCAYTNLTFFL
jgi:hypothetical protein